MRFGLARTRFALVGLVLMETVEIAAGYFVWLSVNAGEALVNSPLAYPLGPLSNQGTHASSKGQFVSYSCFSGGAIFLSGTKVGIIQCSLVSHHSDTAEDVAA